MTYPSYDFYSVNTSYTVNTSYILQQQNNTGSCHPPSSWLVFFILVLSCCFALFSKRERGKTKCWKELAKLCKLCAWRFKSCEDCALCPQGMLGNISSLVIYKKQQSENNNPIPSKNNNNKKPNNNNNTHTYTTITPMTHQCSKDFSNPNP